MPVKSYLVWVRKGGPFIKKRLSPVNAGPIQWCYESWFYHLLAVLPSLNLFLCLWNGDKVLNSQSYCEIWSWQKESTEQCAWHIIWPTNASCHVLFQGDPQIALCSPYLPHSCLTGQALQNNCLLHFLKLALIAKNRIWPQKRNIPCLPIDSQVWEAKTIPGSNFRVLRCNPGTALYLRGRHIWK